MAAPTSMRDAAVEGSTCHCDPPAYLSNLSRLSASVTNMIHTGSELLLIFCTSDFSEWAWSTPRRRPSGHLEVVRSDGSGRSERDQARDLGADLASAVLLVEQLACLTDDFGDLTRLRVVEEIAPVPPQELGSVMLGGIGRRRNGCYHRSRSTPAV